MFVQESAPWYRSTPALLLASLLLPPLGLILLWSNPRTNKQAKLIGSLCIVLLGAGYLYLLLGTSLTSGMFVRNPEAEAHYTALERHRAEQRGASPDSSAASAATAAPLTEPSAAPGDGAPAVPADAAPVAAKSSLASWTDFRGPGRAGLYPGNNIRTDWPSGGLPEMWRQPVGGGYSSFVIGDGLAFTIEQRRKQEVVAAYAIQTGREVWTHGWDAEFVESMGGDGPRATPTLDENRVYALGAKGDLRCLQAKTGKLIWSRNILSDNQAQNLEWGMAASPLIVDDKVIVCPGGTSGKSVVAYKKMSGEPVWKALDDQASYTSPMLVTLGGVRQILVVSARRLFGLTPDNGTLLWEHPWSNSYSINCSQPIVVADNRVFISAGYGKGAAVVELSRAGNGFTARAVWENNTMKNKFNPSVYHEGYIYGLDEGILTCVDVSSGERKWKGGRYGYGQVLLASGHLIITTDSGELVLVKATPEKHIELAKFQAVEGKTWNYPAIADGRLLVRNGSEMVCYNLATE
ncbi:MAG TPA: PQQ-binding-like beta-propeller repeat protein [Blastocatellia bacterium]|jgi:outer membrane protein assembly factor BamB|nr:PQQ-binding-like beta-propeller repeat protein [Blastocatellia bacterium]